jgi:hypothetical protein
VSTGGTRGPGSHLSSGSPRRLAGNVVVESAEAHGDEKRSGGCDKYKINYIIDPKNDHFWDLRENLVAVTVSTRFCNSTTTADDLCARIVVLLVSVFLGSCGNFA